MGYRAMGWLRRPKRNRVHPSLIISDLVSRTVGWWLMKQLSQAYLSWELSTCQIQLLRLRSVTVTKILIYRNVLIQEG
jgi:hypothetical protein